MLFATADTNVCTVVFVEGADASVCKVNVLASITVIFTHFLLIGSVALGYGWLVALLSWAHVNVIAPSAILT